MQLLKEIKSCLVEVTLFYHLYDRCVTALIQFFISLNVHPSKVTSFCKRVVSLTASPGRTII